MLNLKYSSAQIADVCEVSTQNWETSPRCFNIYCNKALFVLNAIKIVEKKELCKKEPEKSANICNKFSFSYVIYEQIFSKKKKIVGSEQKSKKQIAIKITCC